MTDRLDPHTAQYILDAMKAARDRKRYGSTEERATECREDMLEAVEDTCKAALAEAASRPPTLSDWIAVCDRSRFGPAEPQVFHGCEFGVRLAEGVNVIINDTNGAQVFGNGTVPDAWCDSPAALTAALNTLASEVPRG